VKRRTCLKMVLSGTCAASTCAEGNGHPSQFHVDLSLKPENEREMLHNFRSVFRPEASNNLDLLM